MINGLIMAIIILIALAMLMPSVITIMWLLYKLSGGKRSLIWYFIHF